MWYQPSGGSKKPVTLCDSTNEWSSMMLWSLIVVRHWPTDETLTLALPWPLESDCDGGVMHYKQPDCNGLDPERKLERPARELPLVTRQRVSRPGVGDFLPGILSPSPTAALKLRALPLVSMLKHEWMTMVNCVFHLARPCLDIIEIANPTHACMVVRRRLGTVRAMLFVFRNSPYRMPNRRITIIGCWCIYNSRDQGHLTYRATNIARKNQGRGEFCRVRM